MTEQQYSICIISNIWYDQNNWYILGLSTNPLILPEYKEFAPYDDSIRCLAYQKLVIGTDVDIISMYRKFKHYINGNTIIEPIMRDYNIWYKESYSNLIQKFKQFVQQEIIKDRFDESILIKTYTDQYVCIDTYNYIGLYGFKPDVPVIDNARCVLI